MGHDSRSFWHQIYASYLCERPGPRWSSNWVCWTSRRSKGEATWHGWKIVWPNLHTRLLILESICGWSNKLAGSRSRASSDISWKYHHWKVLEVGFLGYKQRSRIWSFVDRNGYGPENGWKDSGNVLKFKTNRRPGKRGTGSPRYKNARIFGSS